MLMPDDDHDDETDILILLEALGRKDVLKTKIGIPF